MKKYHVYGHVVGTKYLGEFEANSKEEALDLALSGDSAFVSMCHQCANECEDPMIEDATVEAVEE